MSTELIHKEITKKIIGASFDVHSFLGNGFQEVIYQRALAWEMGQRNLEFSREIEQDIYYKNFRLCTNIPLNLKMQIGCINGWYSCFQIKRYEYFKVC